MGPWFIITVAVVLLAGIAATTASLLGQSKTITVHGNVIDEIRPDLGVATATISADGATAKPDTTGAFTMAGVPGNAVLRVSAPYYRTNTVTASTGHLTIRLTPLPVALTVTSALTGAPLKATISAPAGKPLPYTIASGGTVRLYRAGPGETLTVTANGYRPAHAVVRSDQTLTVALEPSASTVERQFDGWASQGQYTKIVDWILRPATGYTFERPTPSEQAQMDKSLPPFQLYMTARFLATSPEVSVDISINKPGTTLDIASYVRDNWGHAARVTIDGQTAWHGGPDSYDTYVTAVTIQQLDLEVYGTSTAQTDQIMTRILTKLLGPNPPTST